MSLVNLTIHCDGSAEQLAIIIRNQEKILMSLESLQTKVDAQSTQLTALHTYVADIERRVKELPSTDGLSDAARTKVMSIIAQIDQNNESLARAADGDDTTGL